MRLLSAQGIRRRAALTACFRFNVGLSTIYTLNQDTASLTFHPFVSNISSDITIPTTVPANFSYLGLYHPSLPAAAAAFCDAHGVTGDVLTPLSAFISHVYVNHLLPCQNSCWLCIRLHMPSPDFDIPRWHSDGSYWTEELADGTLMPVYKYGTCLSGPSTLFLQHTPHIVEVLDEADKKRREAWPLA